LTIGIRRIEEIGKALIALSIFSLGKLYRINLNGVSVLYLGECANIASTSSHHIDRFEGVPAVIAYSVVK
jgi:hypothetical protein